MEDERRTPVGTQETTWAATLLLLGVVLGSRHLPWSLLSGIPALAALALSLRAIVLRVRAKESAGAMWSGVGVLFAGYLLAAVAVQAVLYEPVDAYRRCSAVANTDVAQQECETALRNHLGGFGAELLGP